MEYHSDRFTDASLVVYKAEKLVALLPANREEDTLFSHQGLTYGGLVVSPKLKLKDYITLFKELLQHLASQRIKSLHIKELPDFYATLPADELGYIAQLSQAKITRVDTASVIDYGNKLPIQSNRLEGVKKAHRQGLVIKEEEIFKGFWQEILVPNLTSRHGASPTHTQEEKSYKLLFQKT
jgi:hypothetical protein